MDNEKTRDEALDEMDKWGDQVAGAIAHLAPEEVVAYFEQSQARLEQRLGKRLNLRVQPARIPRKSDS
jgi:hypothetical protein